MSNEATFDSSILNFLNDDEANVSFNQSIDFLVRKQISYEEDTNVNFRNCSNTTQLIDNIPNSIASCTELWGVWATGNGLYSINQNKPVNYSVSSIDNKNYGNGLYSINQNKPVNYSVSSIDNKSYGNGLFSISQNKPVNYSVSSTDNKTYGNGLYSISENKPVNYSVSSIDKNYELPRGVQNSTPESFELPERIEETRNKSNQSTNGMVNFNSCDFPDLQNNQQSFPQLDLSLANCSENSQYISQMFSPLGASSPKESYSTIAKQFCLPSTSNSRNSLHANNNHFMVDNNDFMVSSTNRKCGFCYKNGEIAEVYQGHVLKIRNKISCPILRKLVCDLCGATGDNAHTRKYCSLYVDTEKHKPLFRRLANGMLTTSHNHK